MSARRKAREGESAPRVFGTQPGRDELEHLALQDRAFAPDAVFRDLQHPVQPHPAGPCPFPAPDPSRPSWARPGALLLDSISPSRVLRSRPTTSTGRSLPRSGPPRRPPRSTRSRRDRRGRRAAARTRSCGRAGRWARCPWSPAARGMAVPELVGRPIRMSSPPALLNAARHRFGSLELADEFRCLLNTRCSANRWNVFHCDAMFAA